MKDVILKYNKQTPRYTSYPSAPHFVPVEEPAARQWLAASAELTQSLYIHIPFCTEMCWYCGCHTTATKRYAPVEDYIALLLREIKLVRAAMGVKAVVGHIHYGGGSPTMLQPDDFRRISAALHENFLILPDAEIAIEADPRGVTHDKVEAYAAGGINRASFGIQDFSPAVQKAINRVQSFDVVSKANALFRDKGINNINFDLMYGLPLQGVEEVEETVSRALTLSPQRIALFGYAHVPWMKKHMRLIRDQDLPDAAERISQFEAGEKMLLAAGLQPVGLDHFVTTSDSMFTALQKRTLKRNFQGYSTDLAQSMIGLGVSAIGQLAGGYVQNHANMTEYAAAVLANRLPVARGFALSAEDRLRAQVIGELMCYFNADVGDICASHGVNTAAMDGALCLLAPLAEDGLVTVTGRRVTVNPAARQAVRIVAAQFDSYFLQAEKRHSQVA